MMVGLLLAAALWSAPVELPQPAGAWAAAPVPGWLEYRTFGELSRLRLLDASGREVPYRLLDAATDLTSPWRAIAALNLRRTTDGFAVSLDLAPVEPIDALEIVCTGDGGVLAAEVRGGEPVGVLAADARVGRLQGVSVTVVGLPVTDVARLDVRLTTLVPGLEPVTFRVHRTLRPTRAGSDRVRFRAARVPGDERSDRWRMSVVGEPSRIDGIVLEVGGPAVLRRQVVVSVPATDESRAIVLGTAEVARLPLADGRRGIEALRVPLRPGAWRTLEIAIERGGEAPLELLGASGNVARRWLVFPPPAQAAGLELVTGDTVRSDSLERGPLPVHPDDVTAAAIATPVELVPATPTPVAGQPSTALSLLFIAAAALLALLAWRVLRNPR